MKAKKLLSLAVSFAMLLSAGTISALADGSAVAVVDGVEYTDFQTALDSANGKTVTLISDIELSDMAIVRDGITLTLDLAGHAITMSSEISTTTYALQNLGNLTLRDSDGNGSISSRGMYNGDDGNTSPVMTVESGTYNALGTNGGAAIFNYGTAYVNGGNFTSVGGYSLNNRTGAQMTIESGVTANNGIYNSGATLTVNGGSISGNRSGCHVIYAYNSDVTINGGDIYNNNKGNATLFVDTGSATINGGTFGIAQGSDWTSVLLDTSNNGTMTIYDGTFNGGVRVQSGTYTVYGGTFNDVYGSNSYLYSGTVEIKGGTFVDSNSINFAKKYIAGGYESVDNANGSCNVKSILIEADWTTDTDAGFYTVEDTDYGMMRYLFQVETVDTVTEYGIKYIKTSSINDGISSADAQAGTTVSESNNVKVFYGDIVNIPEGTSTEDYYYAAGYVKTASGFMWSPIISNKVSWSQKFTAYTPGGTN